MDRRTARLVVAVDGPSGSGKSSVSRQVAERLGLRYLDTGAMYRAVTWEALRRGVDLADRAAVAGLAHGIPLVIGTDPAAPSVAVGDVDITRAVRESRISAAVSMVATNLDVRSELIRRQREIIGAGGVVVEGRDITTVVAPEAAVRVLLTASEHARLHRRALDVHGRADAAALGATHDEVLRRDADDATVAQFHQGADGVSVIDSSALTLGQTVEAVLDLVRRAVGGDPAGHGGRSA